MYLDRELESWRPMRRALAREDREAFDKLFALARRHVAEAGHAARPVPFDALVMTILLEQQKEINSLKTKMNHEDAKIRRIHEEDFGGI